MFHIFAYLCKGWRTAVCCSLVRAPSFHPLQYKVWIEGYAENQPRTDVQLEKGGVPHWPQQTVVGILFGYYVKTWQSGGFSKVSLQCSLKPYQGAFYSLWLENPSVYLVLWMDPFHMHNFVTSFGKHELCMSPKCWPIHFTVSKKKKKNHIQ